MSLKDKVVLITGAAQGIGQGIALKFAEKGAKIAIFDILEPTKTIKQIEKKGGDCMWREVDVSNENSVQESIDKIISKWNTIDILINNAGIFPVEQFHEISVELFRKVFEINVIGTFICSKYLVKLFLSKKMKGTIINIASITGFREELYQSLYNASKAAIISLTKSTALELTKFGIRVNAIAPGSIRTKGARSVKLFPLSGKIPEDYEDYIKKKFSHLGRSGEPEDIANLALYLASDKANYITGAVFVVDGGRSLL
ncbi:MAG: SDR family oxidoreductase [Candidatus Lokiarchaeota archaeon]|nr:SDR family oxidoreductase [Candidatus Lokiarchaeota archaeon]